MAIELLFTISNHAPQKSARIDLAAAGLKERQDIEAWVIAHPEIVGPDVLIVTSEFAGWASKTGMKDADRLDVLGLARDGRLVVIELKRGAAPSTVHMQVLNYAARATNFDVDNLATVHRQFLSTHGHPITEEEARARLESFAPELTDETLSDAPRLVLVAEDFGLDVTTTAAFLHRQYEVAIELIRLAAYRTASDELVISVSKMFPPPDMASFILGPTLKQQKVKEQKAKEKNTVTRLLDTQAIALGAELRFMPGNEIPKAHRDVMIAWVAQDPSRAIARWQPVASAPLVWDHDGQAYSPTGLVRHIGSMAGIEVGATQGPRSWCDSKGRTLPRIAEEAEGA